MEHDMNLLCLTCTGEAVLARIKQARGEDVEVPIPNEAWTLAPAWQQQIIGGQMVMACVALPTCDKHLQVAELSPADQAVRGGRLLQGTVG